MDKTRFFKVWANVLRLDAKELELAFYSYREDRLVENFNKALQQ